MGKGKNGSAAEVIETLPTGNNEGFTSLKQPEAQGAMKIVRASKLDEEGTTGVVAEGVYEKAEPNKFNAAKLDYFIRGADNTLFIINGTQSLTEQMDELKGLEGSATVRIVYNGKKPTKSGRGWHDFEVLLAK